MQEENYKLTWHTYSDHLRDMMEAMMINDNFADVTLVTNDRKKIKAHRNILSACSSVFKDILEIDPQNNHPLIYLKGIQYTEMESILQFIYLGEARFYEGRMIEFLDAAKNLSIRELGKSVGDGESFLQKVLDTNKMIYEPNDNSPELIDDEEKHRKIHGGGNQCDQQFTQQSNLKTNIQSQLTDVKYACDQCDYQATQQATGYRVISASILKVNMNVSNIVVINVTNSIQINQHLQNILDQYIKVSNIHAISVTNSLQVQISWQGILELYMKVSRIPANSATMKQHSSLI